MKEWGYKISSPRAIDLDKADSTAYTKLIEKVPSAKKCILCGACSATCTVSNRTDFSFRLSHLLFRRGQFDKLAGEMDKCMLCGKCNLICPQGVNTRAMISTMRLILSDMKDRKITL